MDGLSLAVVVAHPDDDAYGMAGMVALHADNPEFRFILIHATDGGNGDIREGFPATRETLGDIRRAEDEAGWRALGREPDRHEWLGYTDGEVDQVPFEELVDRIETILVEEAGARDALAEAFEAQKKYEQVAESARILEVKEAGRRETAALDELGLRKAR